MLRPTVHWGPGEHRVAAPKRAATIYISERNPVQNRSHILRFTPLLITAAVFAQPIRYQHGPINTSHSPWTQLGGDSSHTHTPRVIGSHLSTPDWTSTGDGSITLSFTPQAGVVADDQRVYAVGQDQGFVRHLSAFDQDSGELAWATEIPFAILDSWSTPTLDLQNNTIIAASGFSMVALDRFTGDQVWLTPMDRPIVNASPCITDDLGSSNRLFITDYTFGSATNGSLICINTDPNTQDNPFDPGEILWSTQLPGNCSGNTPAYSDGVVYVS
ncbi:MAG: PQQ-binding-like beta-propeller repeat protein, partial [Phycisphaerales bacterium]|nr:PQQ-binding-like beta-propeller repeat protein [Phycisphaerales bacterium]